jgi:hypothetical protein
MRVLLLSLSLRLLSLVWLAAAMGCSGGSPPSVYAVEPPKPSGLPSVGNEPELDLVVADTSELNPLIWRGVPVGSGRMLALREGRYRGAGEPVLTWTSGDSTIASVHARGGRVALVIGHRVGQAEIEVRAEGGDRVLGTTTVVVQSPSPGEVAVPPAEATVGAVAVRAEAVVEENGVRRVVVSAVLDNTGPEAVTLDLDACPLSFGVYAERPFQDLDFAARQWEAPAGGCSAERQITLAPGERRRLQTSAPVRDALAALPAFRHSGYDVYAHLRLREHTVLVDAGAVGLTYGPGTLAPRAETTHLPGDSLRLRATLTNLHADSVRLVYGPCSLDLLLYDSPERAGTPVWDARYRAPPDGSGSYDCDLILLTHTFAPGETASPPHFTLDVPLEEVLADSLPDGRYYFSARFNLMNADLPDVPAGDAVLALPRPPMPSARRRDNVRYRLDSFHADPDGTLRAGVTAKLNQGGALRSFAAGCPLQLYAYRDRGRRDAAPRSGPPDAVAPLDCAGGWEEARMRQGRPVRLSVEADAEALLGDELPEGRYYFAVVVRAAGYKGRGAQAPIFLRAGEAVLRR